jgi:hypothetical protein
MGLVKNIPEVILAEFESADALYHAAEKIRNAGYKEFDCHSPFPIHGMDQAMGLRRSPLGYIVFTFGSMGLLFALWLTWWTGTVDYPFVISGKPFFSYPAYVPVIFALTVLTSAITVTFAMLAINQLPRLRHPFLISYHFVKFSFYSFLVCL